MIPLYSKEKAFPYLVIDNYLNKEEEEKVWIELNYYQSNKEHLITTASGNLIAKDNKDNALGKSFRIYINDIFKHLNFSNIGLLYKKFQSPNFHKYLEQAFPDRHWGFKGTKRSSTMISYYENADYYKAHHDNASFTMLLWLFKQPKNFTGGDLILPQLNKTIECRYNRMLLFPSYYKHEVLKLEQEHKKEGYGRYAITTFFHQE